MANLWRVVYAPMAGASRGLRRFAASSVTGRANKKCVFRARNLAAVLGTTAAVCGGGYYWRADRRERRQLRLMIGGLGRFVRYGCAFQLDDRTSSNLSCVQPPGRSVRIGITISIDYWWSLLGIEEVIHTAQCTTVT